MKKLSSILLCIFLFSCVKLGTLKENYGQNDLIFPAQQKERFMDYISGEYYSTEFKRAENQKTPMVFAISEDGSSSFALMCDELEGGDCGTGVFILQKVAQYSKKAGKQLKIFAIKNKIVWDGSNSRVQNIDDLNSFTKSYSFIKIQKMSDNEVTFYDEIFERRIDNCDDDNC